MFIPSIDLYDGKAVQWRQGRESVLERSDVFELLESFSLYGEVAIVDLNAALGKGSNRDLIVELLKRYPCRVGGGIRNKNAAVDYLKAGASKIVIGTAAREPFVKELPRDAVVIALDSREDQWLTHGWTKASDLSTVQALELMSERCAEFLYTQVEKEGMMQGLDRDRATQIVKASPCPVTVAGGVTTASDVSFLHRMGARAQIGMALYTGALTLADCFIACVDFDQHDLLPTVVQDARSGDVLMLAYSDPQSLTTALAQRRGVYHSRSRNELWIKGATSGHEQVLRGVDVDCDGDTLLFRVDQVGHACHHPQWSCFSTVNKDFSLAALDRVLADRIQTAKPGSYTAKLAADASLRSAKLREETAELIEAERFDEVRWEAADLIYFTLVEAASHGVSLADITHELRSRHGNS